MKPLTVADAAERLGVTVRRVQQLISEGRLPATEFGKSYMINEDDLKLVADRKPGRPSQKEVAKKGNKK